MKQLLITIKQGFVVMRDHTQFLLVGVLLFVFPLWFISITEQAYTSAISVVTTSEKQQIGILHDTFTEAFRVPGITTEQLQKLIQSTVAENSKIITVQVVQAQGGEYRVVQALREEEIGRPVENPAIYEAAIGGGETFIYESTQKGYREWYAIRKITLPEQAEVYLYSEHTLRSVDTALATKKMQSYLALTAIFLFLIGLAYWISRQINWRVKYMHVQQELTERDLFSSMITHEFRSPLTAIRGYTSFLKEASGLTEEEKRYVTTIDAASDRVLALVNDFLEVARIQSGKLELTLAPCNLHALIEAVIDGVRPLAVVKGLELRFSPALTPITLQTDEKRLQQVLQNLLTNAIKYTEKGSVEMSTEVTPTKVIIKIKDTGMGISAEDQPKLFQPFSRVGGVEKSATVGTGLGMWITRQLITHLQGVIGVESIKGVGTHVVLTFKVR